MSSTGSSGTITTNGRRLDRNAQAAVTAAATAATLATPGPRRVKSNVMASANSSAACPNASGNRALPHNNNRFDHTRANPTAAPAAQDAPKRRIAPTNPQEAATNALHCITGITTPSLGSRRSSQPYVGNRRLPSPTDARNDGVSGDGQAVISPKPAAAANVSIPMAAVNRIADRSPDRIRARFNGKFGLRGNTGRLPIQLRSETFLR